MSALWRATLIGAVLLCLQLPAQAGILNNQAVCSVRMSPGQLEGLGRSGGLILTTKQAYAHCSDGTQPNQVTYFCSTAPTSSNCALDTRAHYSEAALMALYAALTQVHHQLDLVDIFFEGNSFNSRGQQIRIGSD